MCSFQISVSQTYVSFKARGSQCSDDKTLKSALTRRLEQRPTGTVHRQEDQELKCTATVRKTSPSQHNDYNGSHFTFRKTGQRNVSECTAKKTGQSSGSGLHCTVRKTSAVAGGQWNAVHRRPVQRLAVLHDTMPSNRYIEAGTTTTVPLSGYATASQTDQVPQC